MLKSLLLAARPKTLPAAIVPVWVGCVLAWKATGSFSWLLALATVGSAICIQIATNFFNDAIDDAKGADTEARLGPTRVTASGLLSRKTVYLLATMFLVAAAFCAWPLIAARGWVLLAIGIPSLFLAYGYTGGPFPLAYLGLGEIFVVLFFGIIAVTGTVFVQTGLFFPQAAWLGLTVGCLSAVLITINNLRDIEEDTASNKRTLAVRWGFEKASNLIRIEYLVAIVSFYIARKVQLGEPPITDMFFAVLILAFPAIRVVSSVKENGPSPALNGQLALAGAHLLIFALGWQMLALFSRGG
ncbi:1,4-dihydroxy-2-naphthoate octaprenyltransferase [Roseibacillus persicicus]|uniref:1,4-dihydroxy-2-naphthoate octaprenyltransferase n=1 Tax=Roseibacillus persicicus TaxID=454148 RepID=A0A918TP74_9BACT|nr:1,4-dihydroxy-2-naphthoate octaprenyltransferase [Roseibacillus persicicus]GHC50645.1 1,4-dihydroxy-2-naphthoate octaprenyltransferase [Roseibacillus persicicus]